MALTFFSFFFIFFIFLFYVPFHQAHLNPKETSFQTSLISQACFNTSNHKACTSYMHTEFHDDDNDHRQGTPVSIMHAAVKGTINEAIRSIESITSLAPLSINLRERTAIDDCVELLEYSVAELGWSLEEMSFIETQGNNNNNRHREGNLRAWLSAALSNQDTCLEGFDGTDGRLKKHIKGSLDEVTQLISNVLEMYRRLRTILPHFPVIKNDTAIGNYEIPPWITAEEEELMHGGDPKLGMRVDAVMKSHSS